MRGWKTKVFTSVHQTRSSPLKMKEWKAEVYKLPPWLSKSLTVIVQKHGKCSERWIQILRGNAGENAEIKLKKEALCTNCSPRGSLRSIILHLSASLSTCPARVNEQLWNDSWCAQQREVTQPSADSPTNHLHWFVQYKFTQMTIDPVGKHWVQKHSRPSL